MQDLTIHIKEEGQKGMAYIGKENAPEAEMTFSKAGNDLIIIDHTDVGDSLRGKGVGRKLLNEVVELARTRGVKILPLCPYAKSVFDKDASIRDVLK